MPESENGSMDREDSEERDLLPLILAGILAGDAVLEARKRAGAPAAEIKAAEAARANLIATLDEIRGTAAALYAEFRTAFEAGAPCDALFAIRNKMDPQDELKKDATEDLRSIGCFMSRSTRSDV